MKPLRVVQVGTWWMTHADHVMLSMRSMPPYFDVLGICEPDADRRIAAQKRDCYRGLPWLEMEDIYTLRPDAVMIEGPELEQAKMALPFAERGFHLHIDKPCGTCGEDFEKLCQLAREHHTVLRVGYMYRYNPAIVRARELLCSGKIGELLSMEAQMSQRYGRGMLDILGDMPGGMFCYLGCHLVDLLYTIMGEPTHVFPMHRSSGLEGTQALDSGLVLYEYARGLSILKTFANEVNGHMRRYLEISGTKGTIVISPIECPMEAAPITNANHVTLTCTTFSPTHPGKLQTETTHFAPYGRYDDMLVDFARRCRGEGVDRFPIEHERAVHRLFTRSIQNRQD